METCFWFLVFFFAYEPSCPRHLCLSWGWTCLKGNSPECRSSRPGLLGNLSKFIIHQVVELEFNLIDNLPDNLPDCLPDNLIAWLLLLLSTLYRHTHLEDNNSSHTSCSQPFGFWQTGASKVREKHGFFQCFKTVWKPILSQKCFSKEYLPAIFTVSINHSPKHSLFLPPSSCNKTFAVSGHYFYLQRCPHTLGLLIFNYCRFWHSYILKSFSKSIETDNSEWKWTPVVFFFSAQHPACFGNSIPPMDDLVVLSNKAP